MDKRFFRELVKKLADDFMASPRAEHIGTGSGMVATFGNLMNKASKGKQAETQPNLIEMEAKDPELYPSAKTIDEKAVEV